jgi:hypothetical protein
MTKRHASIKKRTFHHGFPVWSVVFRVHKWGGIRDVFAYPTWEEAVQAADTWIETGRIYPYWHPRYAGYSNGPDYYLSFSGSD